MAGVKGKSGVYHHPKTCGFQKGHKPFVTEESRMKMSITRKGKMPKNIQLLISLPHKGLLGDKNPSWKGENICYQRLHGWIRKELGKPNECKHCGKIGKLFRGKWNIHWANKSHKYLRELTDWVALCGKCHMHYDKNYPYQNRKNVQSNR